MIKKIHNIVRISFEKFSFYEKNILLLQGQITKKRECNVTSLSDYREATYGREQCISLTPKD